MTDGWEKGRLGLVWEQRHWPPKGRGERAPRRRSGKRLGEASPAGHRPQTRGYSRSHGSGILPFCVRTTGLSRL